MSTVIAPVCDCARGVARWKITGFESQSINALWTLVHKLPRNDNLTSGMRTFATLNHKEWVGHLMVGGGALAPARLDLLARTTRLLPNPML